MRQRDSLSHRTSLHFIHLVSDNLLHPGSRSFVFSGSCENSSGAVAAVKDRIYKRSAMLPVTRATGQPSPAPGPAGWWVTRGQWLRPALPQVPNAPGRERGKGCSLEQTPGKGTWEGSRLKQQLERHPSIAGGSNHKGSIGPNFANFCQMPFIIFPKGFLNDYLQSFLMWRKHIRIMSWIQILVLLNFRAFKKKGQTKKLFKAPFQPSVHL